MAERLLSGRDRIAWALCFVVIAAWIAASRFESRDPDSALYAGISARLSEEPIARWIAPEWWGFWPETGLTGYFQEHPAGIYWIPAALGRLGLPAVQAAYIFGLAAGLAALLLTSWLVARLTTRDDGRAVLVLLQFMPLAFVFRIRDNHEYPMIVCLLVGLAGLVHLRRPESRWPWLLVAAGLAGGLVIKGVFVGLVVLALVLWTVISPAGLARAPQAVAIALGLTIAAGVAVVYDAAYARATGETFWRAYWERQLGPLELSPPLDHASQFFGRAVFYVSRLLYHPAPWSLALVWAACVRRRSLAGLADQERRGLVFVLAFAVLAVLLLSIPSRSAERYAFSATYMLGAAGAVVAIRLWPSLGRWLTRLDAAVPALPAIVWLALMALRLGVGPWLPRTGG